MPASGRASVSSGRATRRSTQSTPSSEQQSQHQHHSRREKAKSSQSYVQKPRRESSTQSTPSGTSQSKRLGVKHRANSAPLLSKGQVHTTGDEASDSSVSGEPVEDEEIVADPFFQRISHPSPDKTIQNLRLSSSDEETPSDAEVPFLPSDPRARPDSMVEPAMSPQRLQHVGVQMLSSASNRFTQAIDGRHGAQVDNGTMQEVNIGTLGAASVGKSTFIQRALGLPDGVSTLVAERQFSIDSIMLTVRLLEIPFDDLDIEDDSRISWPDTIGSAATPRVDGVFILYDVMNQESLEQVPGMLNAMRKTSIPCVLVSCKCDNHPAYRQVDPAVIEQKAKASFGEIPAMQTSEAAPEGYRKCMTALMRAIMAARYELPKTAAARRRANSSAVRRVSPHPPADAKHSRASSELVAPLLKAQVLRVEGTEAPSSSADGTAVQEHVPAGTPQESFLDLEESPSNDSMTSESPTVHEVAVMSAPEAPAPESGYTFDQLVDRLVAQPLSKADTKFVATFLALYRMFATPGQLLEAILSRFQAVQDDEMPQLMRTVFRLRCLAILEQWFSLYPGDLAHPVTRAKAAGFVVKLSSISIFAVAAKELAANLEVVTEDDDTTWACCDTGRERADAAQTFLSNATMLDDDSDGEIAKDLGNLGLSSRSSSVSGQIATNCRSVSGSTNSSSQTMLNLVEEAQRQAKTLVPHPRTPLSKIQWHAIMDQSDEAIAKELTRMDWIMFTSIRPRDLVRHVTLSADQKKRCKSLENVNRLVEHFNHLACWAMNLVLLRDKPKHRAFMLEKLMRVARKLRELNNYNALGAIIAGINGTAVHRLLQTREMIPATVAKDFMKLEILMGTAKSHFAYRLAWENSPGERIPYLPLLRRDLVSALEGNRTFVGGDGTRNGKDCGGRERVNWRKFEIMGEVVVGVQRAQGVPYPAFERREEVRGLVLDVKISKDEDELYDRSYRVEPGAGAGDRRRFAWLQRGFTS